MAVKITYLELCRRFAQSECSKDELEALKLIFKKDINSRRRFDSINSLYDLIDVLDKRAVIGEDDVEAFRDFAKVLNQRHLLMQIEHYSCSQKMPANLPPICQQQVLRVLPQKPESRKQHAYMIISREVGKNWKDFARALQVREGQIDELQEKHPRSIESRVLEILDFSDDGKDPAVNNEWRTCLLNALSKARRNDLRCSVEHVLNTGSQLI